MAAHAVGVHAFGNLGVQEVHFGGAAGAADPGLGVDDDVLRLDEPGLQQRHEGQLDAGRVAAGVGHHARLLDSLAVELRKAVHHLFLQIHCRMRPAVPLLVHLRIPQAEIGRQVHHLGVSRQPSDDLLGGSVRKATEHRVHIGVVHLVVLDQHGQSLQVPVLRVHGVELLPGIAEGCEVRDLHRGMHGQQPHDLRPSVARRTQHRNLRLLGARGHLQRRTSHIASPPGRRFQRLAVERAALRGAVGQLGSGGGLRDNGLHGCRCNAANTECGGYIYTPPELR
mmetsp:Transcript_17490/g.38109  ORF Transcript_17490/g.38109 Transcript_17490/m.38109 type:complete len:282 (+) Transcript_17490:741-1586(+)